MQYYVMYYNMLDNQCFESRTCRLSAHLINWSLKSLHFFSTVKSCGYPGSPAHASITLTTDSIGNGTIATYTCDNGYELLGPSRRTCMGTKWEPIGIPFCGESSTSVTTPDTKLIWNENKFVFSWIQWKLEKIF